MQHYQYTIRNIPAPVNAYLRKRSLLTGKSLNQTVIDELSQKVAAPATSITESLSWFIGSGLDDGTLQALADEDIAQKARAATELGL